MLESLQLGNSSPFQLASGGAGIWEWLERPENSESSQNLNQAMLFAARSYNAATLADYPWHRRHANQTLSDVGGGIGGFLSGLLASQPSMRGVLVDRPSVIEDAGVRGWLAAGLHFGKVAQPTHRTQLCFPSRVACCLCREALGAEPPRPAAAGVNARWRLLQDTPAGRHVSALVSVFAKSFWTSCLM